MYYPLSITYRILETVQQVTKTISLPENETSVTIALTSFAISVQEVQQDRFQGQAFSALLGTEFGFNEEEVIDSDSLVFERHQNATVSIDIPDSLFNRINVTSEMNDTRRIIFTVFLTESLFSQRQQDSQEVGSIIISARIVGGVTFENLNPPVLISFIKKPVSSLYVYPW